MSYNSLAVFQSPKLPSTHTCLKFQYFMHGLGIGHLSVYSKNETHENVLWTLRGAQQMKTSKWKEASVSLPWIKKDAWRMVCIHWSSLSPAQYLAGVM